MKRPFRKNRYVFLPDNTTFPVPNLGDDYNGGDEWMLRYGSESWPSENRLFIASVFSAYKHMIFGMSQKRRNEVCKQIKDLFK